MPPGHSGSHGSGNLASTGIVEIANHNNPDLDLIMMKQFFVKVAELGNYKLSAEAYVSYTVSKL
jgi:hypothetical protein